MPRNDSESGHVDVSVAEEVIVRDVNVENLPLPALLASSSELSASALDVATSSPANAAAMPETSTARSERAVAAPVCCARVAEKSEKALPSFDTSASTCAGDVRDRSYQLELLQLAKVENVVAYLETGAGKTLVAALLIGEIIPSKVKNGVKKYAVFVVDRVPLVFQQSSYVESVLGDSVDVALFYGDMNVDYWHKSQWDKALSGKNTLFMTAQILLNALRHAVIEFKDIALLIFDEAHHCTKEHPFNGIMREHYFIALTNNLDVPRIFGMSASPVKVKNADCSADFCEEQIALLQRNLDARVVSVTDCSQVEVDDLAPKPEEFVVEYAKNIIEAIDLSSAAVSIISGVKKAPDPEAMRSAVKAIIEELGTFAAGYVASNDKAMECHLLSDPEVSPLSPKAKALIDLLLFERRRWATLSDVDSKFRAIVFVQRRDVAAGLTWILNQAFRECHDPCLLARLVVGARQSSSTVPLSQRSSQAKQTAILEAFRSGTFGVVIATNVIEEGFNVPTCGLVVMFNSIVSSKAYIQSRGRGRHAKARYVVLLSEQSVRGSRDRETLLAAKEGAQAMKVAVKQLKAGDPSGLAFRSSQLRQRSSPEPFLASRSTAACVRASAAPDLLLQFCGTLPQDKYISVQQGPRYAYTETVTGLVTCTVNLPGSSSVWGAECGEPQTTKVLARRLAALAAYRALYDRGLLDEHLFSLVKAKPPLESPIERYLSGEKVSRERSILVEQPEPLLWSRQKFTEASSISAFLYEILLDEKSMSSDPKTFMYRMLPKPKYGIILSKELHEADVVAYKLPVGETLFELSLVRSFYLSCDDDSRLLHYGEAVRSVALDRKDLTGREHVLAENGFHVVPLTGTAEINWEEIDPICHFDPMKSVWESTDRVPVPNLAELGPSQGPALCAGEFSLLQSSHDSKYKVYFTARFDPERTAKHPCAEFVGGGRFESFFEYYEQRHGAKIFHCNAPLLAAYSPDAIGKGSGKRVFYLVPEFCRKVPLSPWALYFVGLMPFWQTFLSVKYFVRRNRIEKSIGLRDVATALQPGRSHSHCVDISYERYEFLGDAVLKVLASMSIFYRNPYFHEGCLTVGRDQVVSNSFLCDASISLGVGSVIYHTGAAIKCRSWPFYLGAPQKMNETFGAKVLADCAESLIGIHYLHGGIDMAIRFLEQLGVAEDMKSMFEEPFRQPSRIEGRLTTDDPRCASPQLSKLEAVIGYTFQRREILVEALTHTSYRAREVLSYERLEFLGDAAIGLTILNDFYKKYQNLCPGELTLLREPALSNDLFARVVISFGLHEFLYYNSEDLAQDIGKVVIAFQNESIDENICDNMNIPKVLGDILESIVGAIVVDQNMRLDEADRVAKFLLTDALDRFASPETLQLNPVSAVTQAVQAQYKAGPVFAYEKSPLVADGDGNENVDVDIYRCTILVCGAEIASETGQNRKSAKRRAALAALRRITPVLEKE